MDINAQQGFYEWVRERRGEGLALVHRLDKETSGVLLLGKSQAANRSLANQFAGRAVHKRYVLLCAHDPGRPRELTCDASVRGKKRRGSGEEDKDAQTAFTVLEQGRDVDLVEARPLTGRTHQVRLHAARLGMPIVGDDLYQGPPGARVFLHAAGVDLDSPGGPVSVAAPLPAVFRQVLDGTSATDPFVATGAALEARAGIVGPDTNAHLWIDRDHDGFADLRVELLGDVALALRTDDRQGPLNKRVVNALMGTGGLRALVEQRRPRQGKRGPVTLVAGELSDPRFTVRELGLTYAVDLSPDANSSGLFLDQRETRRRLLASDLAGKTVLNAFAHTGSLSVAAARAGAETLTLDLSKRYLDWARENLRLNGIDPAEHDFIYGDALDWLGRLAKKGRTFDRVLLDPPSFSTGRGRRKTKTWSVERDLGQLVELGAKLTAPGGHLLVSTNLHRLTWARFASLVQAGLQSARRTDASIEAQTLPLDHRSGPGDPPYLKLAWIQV